MDLKLGGEKMSKKPINLELIAMDDAKYHDFLAREFDEFVPRSQISQKEIDDETIACQKLEAKELEEMQKSYLIDTRT